MKRLLLLHPDGDVYAAVERTLSRMGVTTDVVQSADDVLLRLDSHHHGLVVVDRILAGTRMDEILTSLRAQTSPKPIVIVTSTNDGDLDPNVVSLVVPASYDVSALVGVILACATEPRPIPEDDFGASASDASMDTAG
ncbi:MAG TPA: hypothetical protein VHW00_13680 [Thermoanaerobaculia bacterium]|nr:hypothetical protein [Thermoanaerobaculia bacterium]